MKRGNTSFHAPVVCWSLARKVFSGNKGNSVEDIVALGKWLKGEKQEAEDEASMEPNPDPSNFSVEEEYIAVKHEVFPAGEGEMLCYNFQAGAFVPINTSLSFVLNHTSRFRNLEQHYQYLQGKGWQVDSASIYQDSISELLKKGLIQSKSEFLKNIAENEKSQSAPPPISTIGWITCGRTKALKRSLESTIENNQAHDRKCAYMVMDDTVMKDSRRTTSEMLDSLAREKDVSIRYGGREEKMAFLKALVKAGKPLGLPESVLEFALFDPEECGLTIGANRNALLLATPGQMVLSMDDDAVSEISAPSEPREGLRLFSHFNPVQNQFFPDRQALLDNITPTSQDILGIHEALLGRSVASQINQLIHPNQVLVEEITQEFAHGLQNGNPQVRVTAAGVYGDSGTGTPRLLLSIQGKDRQNVMGAEVDYSSASVSREVFRTVDRPTISEGIFVGGFHMGLDNREALPPFFPVGRNEDVMLGVLLRTCYKEGLVGHLPWAVFHSPVEYRVFPADAIQVIQTQLIELVSLLVHQYAPVPWAKSPLEQLQGLGAYFKGLGSLPIAEFEEFVQLKWVEEISQFVEYLERLLVMHDYTPDYWANDVETFIGRVKDFCNSGKIVLAKDISAGLSNEEAKVRLQTMVYRYGELLTWWPAVLEAAKTVNQQDLGWLKTFE